jgi:GTP diphosphokinase / guanosine-3',5'-bis(diphosphate) 3'-diphosphatase
MSPDAAATASPDSNDSSEAATFRPNRARKGHHAEDAHELRVSGMTVVETSIPSASSADEASKAPLYAAFQAFASSLESYLSADEIGKVSLAFNMALAAHEGQFRATGEPYVTHPLAVAELCASWKLDHSALCAALLHDTLEDTGLRKAEIESTFGPSVANMVDGLSKLDKVKFLSKEDHQAENFRKMLLAMAQDVRVILIKLADRLHNMRTMESMRADKRYRIGRETLDIYAPIAHRLGLNQIYRELQDLSFTNAFPYRSRVLAKAVKVARGTRREVVGKVMAEITKALPERGIQATVYGREKHLYGIYRKMVQKHLSFSDVLDIYGFRVVVNDPAACYLAMGALHALYKPVPGKFKDYIAIPKVNGYQSLHTTLVGPFGTPIEVQIRSNEMHRIAESGVAAHWLYKSGAEQLGEVQKKTHQWLQSLLDIQNDSRDPAEFLEHVKVDLFPDDVYVFTPKGKILPMPRGATAVDFAYMIHTDIGDQCVGVRINGQPVPLRSELRNGDVVSIETSKQSRPNPAWLAFVRTGRARSRIRHYLKTMQFDESAALGERLLAQALNALGEGQSALDGLSWDKLMKESGVKTRQELLADIGLGRRLPAVVARRLAALGESGRPREESPSSGETTSAWQRIFGGKSKKVASAPVLIRGADGIAVQLASCCQPIPGDPIIGHISKGQGLTIHTHDCKTTAKARLKDPDNWVDVEWSPDPDKLFSVAIRATVSNGRGILAKVASAISSAEANITNVLTADDETGKYAMMEFTLLVSDRLHLAVVLKNVRRVQEVMRVNRVRE